MMNTCVEVVIREGDLKEGGDSSIVVYTYTRVIIIGGEVSARIKGRREREKKTGEKGLE